VGGHALQNVRCRLKLLANLVHGDRAPAIVASQRSAACDASSIWCTREISHCEWDRLECHQTCVCLPPALSVWSLNPKLYCCEVTWPSVRNISSL
jgi:hypothetical protein